MQPGTCRAGSHRDWGLGAALSHFLVEDALGPPQPCPLPTSSWPGATGTSHLPGSPVTVKVPSSLLGRPHEDSVQGGRGPSAVAAPVLAAPLYRGACQLERLSDLSTVTTRQAAGPCSEPRTYPAQTQRFNLCNTANMAKAQPLKFTFLVY